MKGSKKPSDVSAAPKIRKENYRLKVGAKSKTKSSSVLRSIKHLAWYVPYKENPKKEKLSARPQIKWKCPPKLVLDPDWHMACGEDSSEVEAQKQRESSVNEAVYPHLSATPSSPLMSPDMEGKHDDDSQIPLISIVPIEEAGAIEMPLDTSAPVMTFNLHSTSESLILSRIKSSVSPILPTGEKSILDVLHGLEGSDIIVAASAAAAVAAATVIESKHEIDTELLIKFLTDPEMMKRLINETRIGANANPRFPCGPKSATYLMSSNSTPDPGTGIFLPVAMDQPIAMKESASDLSVTQAEQRNFLPVAMNQPIPMKESASDFSVTSAERHNFFPVAINQPIPLKESSSDLSETPAKHALISHSFPIQDLMNEARESVISRSRSQGTTGTNEPRRLTAPTLIYNEDQCAKLINQHGVPNAAPLWPLYPSFSKPTLEAASKPMVEQHPLPFFTGIKLVPSKPSFSYLNMEAASKPMVEQHSLPFFTGAKLVPSPPSFSYLNMEAASKPMVEQHASPFFTGMNLVPAPPSFSYLNTEAASKPMIEQHYPPPFFAGMKLVPSPPSFSYLNMEAARKPMVEHPPPPFFTGMELVPSPPSFSYLNMEAASKPMVEQHPQPVFTGMKPVPRPPPFSKPNQEVASKPMVEQCPLPFFTGMQLETYPPSFLKLNLEAVSKPIVQQHQQPSLTGMKPIAGPPPFSSTSRPYMHCMTDGYRALDHSGLKICLESNPSTHSALESNFTSSGTFNAHPFPSMNRLLYPVEDINYYKSLIEQHGEKNIKKEEKLPR